MLIGNSLALLTFIFTAFAKTYVDIVIVRLLYGLVIAMTAPVSYLLISEMTPKHLRGRTQVLLQFFYIAGKMYLLWMMSLFMTSLVEGDWRKVALASAVPCLLMLLGNVFLL
jgi:SP family xylose:H+ symportor-like MFS transporter